MEWKIEGKKRTAGIMGVGVSSKFSSNVVSSACRDFNTPVKGCMGYVGASWSWLITRRTWKGILWKIWGIAEYLHELSYRDDNMGVSTEFKPTLDIVRSKERLRRTRAWFISMPTVLIRRTLHWGHTDLYKWNYPSTMWGGDHVPERNSLKVSNYFSRRSLREKIQANLVVHKWVKRLEAIRKCAIPVCQPILHLSVGSAPKPYLRFLLSTTSSFKPSANYAGFPFPLFQVGDSVSTFLMDVLDPLWRDPHNTDTHPLSACSCLGRKSTTRLDWISMPW